MSKMRSKLPFATKLFLQGIALFALVLWATGCDLYFDVESVAVPDDGDVQDADVDVPDDAGSDTASEDADAESESDDGGDCEPESDEVLCQEEQLECGEPLLIDGCGIEQARDCGGCASGYTCEDHLCVCEAMSDEELCEDHDADACGTLIAVDDCGEERTVSCGECGDELECSNDNICELCAADCEGRCGMVPDGCGGFENCDEADGGAPCNVDEGESCIEYECQEGDCEPRTESDCESDECGQLEDGCGGTVNCGDSCEDGFDCEENLCVCQPESEQELCDFALDEVEGDYECGPINVDDRCGENRDIVCGECAEGTTCQDNECVFDPGICDDLDLETNFEHCGACANSCTTAQTCQSGSCEDFECVEDQGQNPGSCHPIEQTGCDFDTEHCTMTLVFSGGTPSHFETTCESIDEAGDMAEGESCSSGSDCAEGLFCIGWDSPDPRGQICSRMCDRHTQEGCGDDEFCSNPFFDADDDGLDIEEIGFCSTRCAPDPPDTCGSGQRCTAHPGFPQAMCTPNFYCLSNGGSAGKSEGSECNRAELHLDGCPAGLTCAPVEEVGEEFEDRCVEPCQKNSDCEDGNCLNAPAPWDAIRYCDID